MKKTITLSALALSALLLTGCEGQPTLFPNPDPALRQSSTQLAATAAKRFPYKSDAPHVHETRARAQAAYSLNRLEVVQWTEEDWSDVEVWVNRKYVCYVPRMENRKLKEIHFPMLFDENGHFFPFDNSKTRVEKVELYHAGTFYDLTVHNADF